MWFKESDIIINNIIQIDDLHGYVLPHAGTAHTGNILSHTLQFKPTKFFNTILILYYPVYDTPNVGKYYHEYYVPYMY